MYQRDNNIFKILLSNFPTARYGYGAVLKPRFWDPLDKPTHIKSHIITLYRYILKGNVTY